MTRVFTRSMFSKLKASLNGVYLQRDLSFPSRFAKLQNVTLVQILLFNLRAAQPLHNFTNMRHVQDSFLHVGYIANLRPVFLRTVNVKKRFMKNLNTMTRHMRNTQRHLLTRLEGKIFG